MTENQIPQKLKTTFKFNINTSTPKSVSSPTPKSTHKSTMKPSSKTTPAPSVHHIKITANGTSNVREKPDPKSTRVGHVKKDEVYELIKTASNGWFKIRLKDGKQGYVSGNMAEKID